MIINQNLRLWGSILFVQLISLVASASGGEGGGHGGEWDNHATHLFTYQLINVTILIVALVYFLKKPIQEFLNQKSKAYLANAEVAKKSLALAQANLEESQKKLSQIEANWSESLMRAQAEAAEQREKLESLAQENAERALAEAKKAIEAEKNRLQNTMIQEVVESISHKIDSEIATWNKENKNEKIGENIIRALN